jgi:HdeA/HdeB family
MFKGFVVAVSTMMALPLCAQDVDYRQFDCKGFLALPSDRRALILTFLEGYFIGRDGKPPIQVRDTMLQRATAMGTYCAAHRDADIVKAAETFTQLK